ncbi:hypothetical protein QR680_008511 [Steinernema hermaphroditum]|uniref:Uncharacterized protein n=1 Tax=Steinernema hermaphroditum TaxID=289476 RepID=A0AA39M806_9BILA|nr:hypothetical protein QR680_008511 [Steinernema hermaphroditum]
MPSFEGSFDHRRRALVELEPEQLQERHVADCFPVLLIPCSLELSAGCDKAPVERRELFGTKINDSLGMESFRSDALKAIEEDEMKHSDSYRFFIPEGVSIKQCKENSWEPSVFGTSLTSAEMSLDSRTRSFRNKQPEALKDEVQSQEKTDVSMSFSHTIVGPQNTSVPFQSTPVAPRANGTPMRAKGRDIFASRMFGGLSESQIPTAITRDESPPVRSETNRVTPNKTIETVAKTTKFDNSVRSTIVPSNSMIAELLDKPADGANATQFIAGLKKRREARRVERERHLSVTAKLLDVENETTRNVTAAPSMSGRLQPRNMSTVVSNKSLTAGTKRVVGTVTIGDKVYELVEKVAL